MKFAIGKKLGMTTIYTEDGAQNVTLVEIEPNTIDITRSEEKNGYTAVRLSAPGMGRKEVRKEFRVKDTEGIELGSKVDASTFTEGDIVSVSAPTKAKGFQGVVKRHNFKGGPASHGHRHVLRSPGSIGSAFPQHVRKGKRMAGRVAAGRATNKGLKVVHIDAPHNIIAVKGSVPGVAGRVVEVVTTN